RFIEKPQAAEAERYIAAGDYFWNGGIFLFPAALYLSELERLRPDMLAACKTALKQAKADADFIRLDKAAFADCPADSIDYAVMEHTSQAAVVPVGMGWSDLGSWDALWEMSDKDPAGNALSGKVVAEDTRNCYLRSENRGDRGRGPRRRRDRRCGHGGAAQSHPRGQAAGRAAPGRAARRGRRAADRAPSLG